MKSELKTVDLLSVLPSSNQILQFVVYLSVRLFVIHFTGKQFSVLIRDGFRYLKYLGGILRTYFESSRYLEMKRWPFNGRHVCQL